MPTVPRATVTRRNGSIPTGDVAPDEAAAIRASVSAKEQAPSSRVQAIFENWREVADALGSPFETERIPISKLRQMRRDPMLGFGLSFIKTPHIRAKKYIKATDRNGPNAQIAAHLDHDLRRIWGSLVLQWTNSLDFGFQAIAKRFEFRTPTGTFLNTDPDTGEETEQPIWNEGNIQPIAWKPFVALRPEGVNPVWDNNGEFGGIEYTPNATGGGGAPAGTGARQTGGGSGGTNKESAYKIDLYHSLWITNEKDGNFGSIFGYPRLGYAFRYWWSYWFRWAVADRAFERKADPSVKVYFPDGQFQNEDGTVMDNAEYALLIGDRMRSGGVIALPSDVYEDANGRGTIRQWEIDFTKDAVNFEPFDKSFDYLDVQKLRSLWIPEQAFLEGKGGTSSRNVAAEMSESFIESQAVLNSQIVDSVNRWLIPQWLAVNYPEFVANGGVAELVVQGFADEDVAFMTQLVQLIGQQESGAREIMKLTDMRKVLDDRGVPIVSFAEQQRREAQLIQEAQAAQAPAGIPAVGGPGGQAGTQQNPAGFTQYVQPRDVIHLASSGTRFIESLPNTPTYEDPAIKGFARQLWTFWHEVYADEYERAIDALAKGLKLSEDHDDELALELAERNWSSAAKRALRGWKPSAVWLSVVQRSRDAMNSIMKRASAIEMGRLGISSGKRPAPEDFDAWLSDHLDELVAAARETTQNEVHGYVTRRLEEGEVDHDKIVADAREKFGGYADWKTDRLVRTEVREIYNQAVLLTAKSAGIKRVQALDARHGPTDHVCEDRNGKIYTIDQAARVDEHPNGTLAWRLVPAHLSIERRDDLDGQGASLDTETSTLVLADDLPEDRERQILIWAVDELLGA